MLHGDQHQLAAPARHPHVPGHHRLRPWRTGFGHYAVYAGRRDGAGDHARRAGAAARGGAGGHPAVANRAPRRAGGLRLVYLQCRHEIGFARLRHPGVRAGGVRRRAAGAPYWPALARIGGDRVERARRAVGLRVPDVGLGQHPRRRQPDGARRRLARGRPNRVDGKIHPRCRNAANLCRDFRPAGQQRRRARLRGHRQRRTRLAFLRLRAHHGALPDGVLRAAGFRLE